jgi:catechol 2,3-dioxygenase-like lactoylglutathione lyase family enzyme
MRALRAWLALAVYLLAGAHAAAAVLTLRAFGMTVSDIGRTERFYRDTLGFQTVSRKHVNDPSLAALFGLPPEAMDILTMRLGDQQVEFTRFERPGRAYPSGSQSPDRWFQHIAIIVSDMDVAAARVRASGAPAISTGGPQTLPARNGRVRAFKFRDPDGHPLELLWFPPGQGRAMWHGRNGLFLGIDHSAIAVASTAASLDFYQRGLGLRVAYAVTNIGPAQDRLDGVSNAVVRITGLFPAAQDAPGIEFLDYRSPETGRAAPVAPAGDIVHAHSTLVVDNLSRILAIPGLHRLSRLSIETAPGVCAASVFDPDNHVVVLEQIIPRGQTISCDDSVMRQFSR